MKTQRKREAQLEYLAQMEDLERRKCEQSLRFYMDLAWDVVNPGTPLTPNWHIDLICDHLTAVLNGDIRRLIINMPPRMGKSTLCSQMFPTWVWTVKPESRWIFHSHNQDLATQDSVARRNIIESPFYQQYWGNKFQLSTDQNVKTEFQNTVKGKMAAHGNTGKGGDFIIVDDPHSAKQAESDVQRQSAVDFFNGTLRSRLDQPKTGRIVIIMQRLHESDLSGVLLSKRLSDVEGVPYEHLNIPIIADKTKTYVFPTTKQEVVRQEGELMMADRIGMAEMNELKIDMGSYRFAGQYMQRPAPAEGAMLKRAWFRFYNDSTKPKAFDRQVQSWDCTFKGSDGSDYVVGQVWGQLAANYYLLHMIRKRMTLPETIKAIETVSKLYPDAMAKYVEDKANGPAVIDSLQHKIEGLLPVQVNNSKEARVSAVSPIVEAGNIYLPDPALNPWVEDFLGECTAFPKAAHDDTVDAFTQAILQMQKRSGLLGYYKEQFEKQQEEKKKQAEQEDEAAKRRNVAYGHIVANT